MTDRTQLYLITPPRIEDLPTFSEALKAAFDGGPVACVQLRLKTRDGVTRPDDEILKAAEEIAPLVQKAGAAFLINDRPDLAKQSGADGVHLGQSDATYHEARAMLGDEASIGVTCHNSTHLGLLAGEAGADYVAFGAFFPTETKDASTQAEPDILRWWSTATTVPCVAIGGITAQNCDPLVVAGADFLAVSGAVWGHRDGPRAAVAEFHDAIRMAHAN